ncbi:MAG: GNAT family N-acetyltransferase [Sediminibacterium sp.]|jgi:RimJ/RimL family protein N-acetyltransferase|nr:GNAT family N-acetyltransferase [Sediminibacterium sp.]
MNPVLSVVCNEKKGVVTRHIYPLVFTSDNLVKFWQKASQFPVIFGRKLESPEDFMRHFFTTKDGNPYPTGLFWVVDDFVGVFYLTEIFPEQADAHFTFFDRKLEGREALTVEMMRHVFEEFPSFQRLNVSLPCYVNEKVFQFVSRIGFKLEGRKRSCSYWKGKWFDAVQYGVLRRELLSSKEE